MKSLILLGAGGHCAAVADVVRGTPTPIAGVLSKEGDADNGLVRLGGDDWLDTPQARDHQFLVAVGQVTVSPLRARLFGALVARQLQPATVVAADAYRSPGSELGAGTVLMHRVVVGPNARIGVNGIVNTGAIVEHDVVIGDHCHVSTGAILNGGVRLGSGVMVGSGAVVLQQVSICDAVVVGAGSVVTRDITSPGVYVGAPARKIQ